MAGGKASGKDRDYQATCRDVWMQRSAGKLKPYTGTDGLDVPMCCGGTTWTFDVLLEDDEGRLHAGEAKRWSRAVPQDAIRAFAGKVADLSAATQKEVAGIFFAKQDAQAGALGVAEYHGILVVISGETQPLPAFSLDLLYANPNAAGRKKRRHGYEEAVVETARVSDSADAEYLGPDGRKQ